MDHVIHYFNDGLLVKELAGDGQMLGGRHQELIKETVDVIPPSDSPFKVWLFRLKTALLKALLDQEYKIYRFFFKSDIA